MEQLQREGRALLHTEWSLQVPTADRGHAAERQQRGGGSRPRPAWAQGETPRASMQAADAEAACTSPSAGVDAGNAAEASTAADKQHALLVGTFLQDYEEEAKQRTMFENKQERPLLMAPAKREAMVRDLALKMGAADGESGAGAAHALMRMIDAEETTHVGIDIGLQVVAELMKDVVQGVTKGDDLWRVMNPMGARVYSRPDDGHKAEIVGRLTRSSVVKVTGMQGLFLELPPQVGLGFFKRGYCKVLLGDGRKSMRRVTDLRGKLPMIALMMSLTQFRHACLALAKIPRLMETVADWTTQKGEGKLQQQAFELLQRLHTVTRLLRASGDGGHADSVQRALMTRCVPVASELHAMRTNKAKFPALALDSAIVMTNGSESAAESKGKGDKPAQKKQMPPHMQPVALSYGIGTHSILSPAPKSFLSLRHQAAPMVLAPPSRQYSSLLDDFPIDSPVCTFDRVRI